MHPALSAGFEELRSTSHTYELKFPLCRLSLQKPETTMGKKRSRVAWESLASLAVQWSWVRIERGRERAGETKERGERGAHLHAEPQSDCGAHRQLARFVLLRFSTGGIGIQRGKWKRISPRPLPRVAPRQWRRDEFLVHFYPFPIPP